MAKQGKDFDLGDVIQDLAEVKYLAEVKERTEICTEEPILLEGELGPKVPKP